LLTVYQTKAQDPVNANEVVLEARTFEAMWRLFQAIGRFWGNTEDIEAYQSRFHGFLLNRIALNPLYKDYYTSAQAVIADLIVAHGGEDPAYRFLFTNGNANQPPPETPLQSARQRVSNEFISIYLALGGFKTFGAINYPGYFGGANVPGSKPPYRTPDEHES